MRYGILTSCHETRILIKLNYIEYYNPNARLQVKKHEKELDNQF